VLPALSVLAIPLCLRPAAARPGSGGSPDLTGAALLTAAAASLLVLIQSSSLELGAGVVVLLAVVLVLAAGGLVLWTGRRPQGFVPRELATDGVFLRAALAGAGVYAGLFGTMAIVPQALAQDHGWSVFAIGGWLLPGAVVGAVLSRVASGLTAGRGGSLLLAGTAVAAAALLGLVGLLDAGPALMICAASLGFASFAVTQVVVTGLMSARTPPMRRGGTIALLNLAFFVGGGAGSAVAGSLARSMELTTTLGILGLAPLLGAALGLSLPRPDAPPAGNK
jgi:hypothetical protein